MLNALPVLSLPIGLVGAPAPPTSPAPPTTSPVDELTLDDYKPHLGRYAPLAGWPVAGAALGAWASSSSTVAIAAGVLAGGTAGLMLGASLGLLVDKLRGKKGTSVAGKLAFAGCLVGGVLGGLGGSIIPPSAATLALGLSGAALGVGIAAAMTKNVREKQADRTDARARTGEYHLSTLFNQINERDGHDDPEVARHVRAMERLEAAGWKFGIDSETFEAHVRNGDRGEVKVLPPSGGRFDGHLDLLPALAYLTGTGDASDLKDPALVSGVQRFVSQGRELRSDDWRSEQAPEPSTPEEAALRLAEICRGLQGGFPAIHVHDDVKMKVVALDGAALDAALKKLDAQIAEYDRHLAPAFASGSLVGHKTRVYEALLAAPTAPDLGHSAPLLLKLVAARPEAQLADRTQRGLETFETLSRLCSDRLPMERAVNDVVTRWADASSDAIAANLSVLAKALESVAPEQLERFHDTFVRALPYTGEAPETAVRATQVLTCLDPHETEKGLRMLERLAAPSPTGEEAAALETLTRAASRQQGYNDVRVDYATLMALRDESAPLADATRDYEALLSGLTSLHQAAEAAPTYAFIRSGLKSGRFGDRTYDRLVTDFFTDCAAGAEPRRARENLLHAAPTSDSTVKKDDGVVIIGGIPVPVRR